MTEIIITTQQFESFIEAQRKQQAGSCHAEHLQGSKVVIRYIELFNGVKVQVNANYLHKASDYCQEHAGQWYFSQYSSEATHVCIKLQSSTYNCFGTGARSNDTHEAARQAIVNLCTHGMTSTEVIEAMPPLQNMFGEWSLEFKYKIANLHNAETEAKPVKNLNDFDSAADYIAYLKS